MPRKGGIELYVISAGQGMSASTVFSVKITKENESRFREESVDIFRVKNAAKRSFLCKDRREFGSLQSTLRDLKKTNETRIKEYEDNKRNLQWVLYNLRHQKTGLSPLGSIIAGGTHRLASSRGMQAESDCRQIKSIRRPLAPETTRDHGNRPALQPNLQSKEGSVIPRAVEREILKRQTMRLKTKNQERLEGVKQREMQLEDMVGVYTRINMVKGSLNYKGKPRHSTDETKISGAQVTSIWKYQYNSSSIEVEQAAESVSSKEAGWSIRDNTYRVFLTNVSNRKVVPSMQAKAEEVSSIIPKQTRKNVKRRLAVPRVKNVVLEVGDSDYKDSFTNNSEKEELEHSKGPKVLPCEELKENRKGTFEKISAGSDSVEKISYEVNDMKTRESGQEFAKLTAERIANSSSKALGENSAKKWVCAVKNKVLLPLRFRRQTIARRGNRTNLQTSDRRHSYIKDSDSATKENMKGKTIMVPNEEHNAVVEQKPDPLSAGKLQKLIREKVLSQSQKSDRRANKKTVLLADYMRTLQKHMGIKDVIPESNSPDFSETPFIAAEKRFGWEDEQYREPRAVDRRLETLQRQIVRLPASFTLLDSDLVED